MTNCLAYFGTTTVAKTKRVFDNRTSIIQSLKFFLYNFVFNPLTRFHFYRQSFTLLRLNLIFGHQFFLKCSAACHLVFSHLVFSHFVLSHFVFSHFVFSHFVFSHFVLSHFVLIHFVFSHFVFSHFVLSHFVFCHFVFSHFVF